MDGQTKDGVPPVTRRAWQDANVRPLWESTTAHKLDEAGPQAHLWRWATMRPLMLGTIHVSSPAAVERRVLSLVNPENCAVEDESTVRTISAALQILLPGEAARPHRHSMNALRFVLEGSGAYTIVDGKRCLMEEGDLILTPGWCWHEHEHRGNGPIIWLDVLDVPFHNVIGTSAFEPGPVHDLPATIEDGVFVQAGLLPDNRPGDSSYSPVFRYPKGAAVAALKMMPVAPDGSRRLRYANPTTGGPVMALLDCTLTEIAAGQPTQPARTNANAVVAVVDGEGESVIGSQLVRWGPKDVFSIPQDQWVSHTARTQSRLFTTSDREIYRRLGLLYEESSDQPLQL
jgi:gentisate 1,2-dioxygenase